MRTLDELSRGELATLGREYMLFGHLLNRGALPHVHFQVGAEAREAVAIEEWMGASPVYTRRMQARMGFTGTGVGTIFKGFQLDVGFPHQYMDVRYDLESEERGTFWLVSCGALLEVEQYGEAAVRSMCHAIEDPTFDASAVATNPRARCRPIHRPPRTPADRVPHCRWEVFVDGDAEPLREAAITRRVSDSRLARITFTAPPTDATGGRDDYAGPFDPEFRLEHLSRAALVDVCREFLVQDHLLIRSLMIAVAERAGDAVAHDIATKQWMGAGAVAAGRLHRTLASPGDGVEAIAGVLRLHPAFVPGYSGVRIAVAGERARIGLEDCEALREGDGYTWSALLDRGAHSGLDAMVRAVNPRARCIPATPAGAERLAWDVLLDGGAASIEMPPEVAMVSTTNTARFAFRSVAPPR
jgi:hypothetical protein